MSDLDDPFGDGDEDDAMMTGLYFLAIIAIAIGLALWETFK